MNIFKLLLFLLFFTFNIFSGETDFAFINGGYEEIKDLGFELIEKYPLENNIFIGVGRSPTPVMALFEVLKINYRGLPLSNFRYGVNGNAQLSAEEEKILFRHFENIMNLSSPDILGKNIVLVDYSQSGLSLRSAARHLRKWLLSKNLNPNLIKIAALSGKLFTNKALFTLQECISLEGRPQLDYHLGQSSYELFAPYGAFDIKRLSDEIIKLGRVPPNLNFKKIVDRLRVEIANDHEFKAFNLLVNNLENPPSKNLFSTLGDIAKNHVKLKPGEQEKKYGKVIDKNKVMVLLDKTQIVFIKTSLKNIEFGEKKKAGDDANYKQDTYAEDYKKLPGALIVINFFENEEAADYFLENDDTVETISYYFDFEKDKNIFLQNVKTLLSK